MRKNKEIIEETLNGHNKSLGCWDPNIEKISKAQLLEKVIPNLDDTTDVLVSIKNQKYVLEIYKTEDSEIDFKLWSLQAYQAEYGFDDNYIKEKFF